MKQELWFDKAVSEWNRQADQIVGMMKMCQDQSEKIANLYADQAMESVQESQKAAKEWVEVSKKMTADCAAAVKANAENAARMFSPLATA